jgi:tetratricopeptide (TPR) repeat protein
VVLVALAGPWSPLALDRANARYADGDATGALADYRAVAEGWHFPGTRAEAALRAGLLCIVEGDSAAAAAWLRRATELYPEREERGAVWSRLGQLYLDAFGDPVRAGEAFERAAIEVAEPAASWMAAGRAWEQARQPERAWEAYRRAEADPALRVEARAATGRVEAQLDGVADADG